MPEAGQTEAVKLTLWPVVEGLAEEVSTVVVPSATAGLVTTWPPSRSSKLPVKLPSGVYVADTGCGDPFTVRFDRKPEMVVEQLSLSRPPRNTGSPKFDPSTTNCTEPVGTFVPEAGHTLATKSTESPGRDGLLEDRTVVVVPIGAFTTWPLSRSSELDEKAVSAGVYAPDTAWGEPPTDRDELEPEVAE